MIVGERRRGQEGRGGEDWREEEERTGQEGRGGQDRREEERRGENLLATLSMYSTAQDITVLSTVYYRNANYDIA
jgi:hypothetical protein